MSDDMAKGCNNCPARLKCAGLTYRGSECAALRHRYGAPGDPEIHEGVDDLISRKALKEFIMQNGYVYANTLDTFPAVDPHKHGRWIIGEMRIIGCPIHCSECGWGSDYADRDKWMHYPGHKFCGACGAIMDGGDEK